jgi:hypothetical protein
MRRQQRGPPASLVTRTADWVSSMLRNAEFEILFVLFFVIAFLLFKDLVWCPLALSLSLSLRVFLAFSFLIGVWFGLGGFFFCSVFFSIVFVARLFPSASSVFNWFRPLISVWVFRLYRMVAVYDDDIIGKRCWEKQTTKPISVFFSFVLGIFFLALWQTARPEYNQILSKKGQEAGSSLFWPHGSYMFRNADRVLGFLSILYGSE